jgi:hypothetical protein
MGDNGEISTYPDYVNGERIEIPMVREDTDPPPCTVCPKIPRDAPKHWEYAVEFEPWFWEVVQWYRECAAVGDFGDPDPLMRALAAEVHQADQSRRSNDIQQLATTLAKYMRAGL